jgi:glycosyltransferase involved in cell wall biosynthesis
VTLPPELSIVIPAYNEEHRLPQTLEAIHHYIHEHGINTEIIVVDDGSSDGTSRVADSFRQIYPQLRVLSNPQNCGKGSSVRRGMLEAPTSSSCPCAAVPATLPSVRAPSTAA